MDDKGYKPSEGSCIISEDVIATIASTAALEVQGVASMAQRPTDIRGPDQLRRRQIGQGPQQ